MAADAGEGAMTRTVTERWMQYRAERMAAIGHGMVKCAACRCDDLGALEIDHILPRARGGTNALANLQLLCSACNRAKGSLMPDEWAAVCLARAQS